MRCQTRGFRCLYFHGDRSAFPCAQEISQTIQPVEDWCASSGSFMPSVIFLIFFIDHLHIPPLHPSHTTLEERCGKLRAQFACGEVV